MIRIILTLHIVRRKRAAADCCGACSAIRLLPLSTVFYRFTTRGKLAVTEVCQSVNKKAVFICKDEFFVLYSPQTL